MGVYIREKEGNKTLTCVTLRGEDAEWKAGGGGALVFEFELASRKNDLGLCWEVQRTRESKQQRRA